MANQERPKGIQEKGFEVKTLKQGLAWFKERVLKKIASQVKGARNQDMVARALVFSKVNTDSLVIIGDTKKDTIIMAYNNEFMVTDIKSKFLHLNQRIIRKVLNKEYKNMSDEQVKDTKAEFIHVLNNLLIHFIEQVINKPKVAEEVENNKKD